MPPLGWFPAGWLSLPLVVWLLDGAAAPAGRGALARWLQAFRTGWCFGFGYFLGGLWWIGAAFLADAGAFIWLMPGAVLLLPAGLALFHGLATALARMLWPAGWRRIVILAVALSAAEWLRGHILTGFPWNAYGYTLMPSPLMMQGAALVGLWGMTLLAFLVFAAPALLAGGDRGGRRGDVVACAAILALFLADLGYGAARLAGADGAMVPDVRLRLVQPAIAQDEKWSPGRDEAALQRYFELSARGMTAEGAAPFTVLVWPETALPFFLAERPGALAAIGALLPRGTSLVTGSARELPRDAPDLPARVFNSIFVIDDEGVIRDAYDKVHLVPFGEYLPVDGLLSRLGLHQMISLPGGFDAGVSPRTLTAPGAPAFGALICYEIIFPGAAVDAEERPAWLLNVTNDGWFGDTPGPRQHLQQATVRAVEEGLPLARAANTGISAIVDPYGRSVAALDLGSVGVVDGPLPAALAPTLYARWRDWPFFAAAAGLFLIAMRKGFHSY